MTKWLFEMPYIHKVKLYLPLLILAHKNEKWGKDREGERRNRKVYKQGKKVLTKRDRFGILTKLSDRGTPDVRR